MKDWAKKDLELIWHPCSQMKDYETLPPIVIDHAKGCYLYEILSVLGGVTYWVIVIQK